MLNRQGNFSITPLRADPQTPVSRYRKRRPVQAFEGGVKEPLDFPEKLADN